MKGINPSKTMNVTYHVRVNSIVPSRLYDETCFVKLERISVWRETPCWKVDLLSLLLFLLRLVEKTGKEIYLISRGLKLKQYWYIYLFKVTKLFTMSNWKKVYCNTTSEVNFYLKISVVFNIIFAKKRLTYWRKA